MTKKKPKSKGPTMQATQAPVWHGPDNEDSPRFEDDGPRYEPPEELLDLAAAVELQFPPPEERVLARDAVQSVSKRMDKGLVLEIEPLWAERLGTMATSAGVEPAKFVETLLRRAWVALPLGKGRPV